MHLCSPLDLYLLCGPQLQAALGSPLALVGIVQSLPSLPWRVIQMDALAVARVRVLRCCAGGFAPPPHDLLPDEVYLHVT